MLLFFVVGCLWRGERDEDGRGGDYVRKRGGGGELLIGDFELGGIYGFVEFSSDENVSVLFCVRPITKEGGGGLKRKKKALARVGMRRVSE